MSTAKKNVRRRKAVKKNRVKLFYPIYLMCVLAAVWGVFIICQEITKELEYYEGTQPKYAAEEAAQLFLQRDFETLYSYQNPEDFAGESAEVYAAYMSEFTRGKELTWNESYSSGENRKNYAVRMDGKRLFEFVMTRTGDADERGNATWELSEVRTLGISTTTRTVTAPAESTVYVDGRALGADNIIEEGIMLEEQEFLLDDEAKSPTMCVYEYEICMGNPEVRVVDAKGRENALTVDAAGNVQAARNSDDSIKAEVEERVIEIVKAFANFTSEDLTQYKMLKFARKGTNAYEKIESFDNNWFGKHDGVAFENMRTDDYMIFSNDTFACDIHFDYIIEYDDADDLTYETNYRFYFVERDDVWYLYDFKMVNQ